MRRATSASSAAFWSRSQFSRDPCQQLVAHPGQHHVGLDRLGDVVGGAVLEAALFVARVVQGGEEDHRNVLRRRVLAQAAST
jgi:hypothetical protein